MNKLSIIDLDNMLHIIAAVQFKSGNRDNKEKVRTHVRTFTNSITGTRDLGKHVLLYQVKGNNNYRKEILPAYKAFREPSEAILCWKETILDEFDAMGAIGLKEIESDDAMAVIKKSWEDESEDNVAVIVTADKDMYQLGGMFYNPYARNKEFKDRWKYVSYGDADVFFWSQILAGDPTDVSKEYCGIDMIGMKTAETLLITKDPKEYPKIVTEIYREKVKDNPEKKAKMTYMMLKLVDSVDYPYLPQRAKDEINNLIKSYPTKISSFEDGLESLFEFDEAD